MKGKLFLFILLLIALDSNAQEKVAPTHELYNTWTTIRKPLITDDGRFVCYEENPGLGDGNLLIFDNKMFIFDTIARGCKAAFARGTTLFACKLAPPYEQTRKAKKDKVKEENMPKDSLYILNLISRDKHRYARVKDFQFPKENADFLAIHFEKDTAKEKKPVADTTKADTSKADAPKPKADVKKDKSKKKKDKKDSSSFMLLYPDSNDSLFYKDVTGFALSRNGSMAGVMIQFGDSLDTAKVMVIDTKTKSALIVFEQQGYVKSLAFSNDGNRYAFLYSADTTKEKVYSLLYSSAPAASPVCIADTQTVTLPIEWSPSEFFSMYFSDDGSKLVFGSAPHPIVPPKDTLNDDEKVKVDIWTWDEPQMQSQQLKNLDSEKKRTYLSVFHTDIEKVVLLGDTVIRQVSLQPKSLGRWALGIASEEYECARTWDFPGERDFYLINNVTGKKYCLAKKTKDNYSLSPDGDYYIWYSQEDSSWYSATTEEHKKTCLTCTIPFAFYDEEDDQPKLPDPYGIAGWLEDDKYVLLYDRFDIWKIDPSGKQRPLNITCGRSQYERYKYIQTDEDDVYFPLTGALLKSHNDSTRAEGFSTFDIKKKQEVRCFSGNVEVQFYARSKISGHYLWSYETYRHYPELRCSDSKFITTTEISQGRNQKANLRWGDAQLVKWTSYSGRKLEGILITPDNIDPAKKYPMIVYFYERNSQNLHSFFGIKPSRSVINFPMYTGNGYVVFIPDIVYGTGSPGEDAYDCIISGTEAMLKQFKWIDPQKLGMQGQSWGGYQVAYLVTRTGKMFAAAMAGAAVSNMTSAYGGVRWESGQSRMFQYEKGQSRLGATLWDSLDLYLRNSPLFFADKIETPLLMMNNDNDGAVPWYQGIELYSAMRRFQKPCWLLVYNNEEHNLGKRPNMVDLSIRMMQFFDYYLKDAPMPPWMKDGLPALNKGQELRYE